MGNNLWKISVPLPYGKWAFKLVADNNNWLSPPGFQVDGSGNALFWIDDTGVSKQAPGPSSSQGILAFVQTKAQDPHWSFPSLPISNGFSASKFNVFKGLIDTWDNHIFQQVPSIPIVSHKLSSMPTSLRSASYRRSTFPFVAHRRRISSYQVVPVHPTSYLSKI